MPSKFKISESNKTIKVGFNWLSPDLAVLLLFFSICLLAFMFLGYAVLNSEKVPIKFFLGCFAAFLFICYLGYATFLTLFNRTFFSLDQEELVVKRKPFIGLEYPETIPVNNIDKLVQKSYLFFYYKVVAKLKDGAEIPVFNYHYYDSTLFKDLQQKVNKLLGLKSDEVISVTKEKQTTETRKPIAEKVSKDEVSDTNIYAKQVKSPPPKKKVFKIKKKQSPAARKQDYPGTQAPVKKVKKEKMAKTPAKSRKKRAGREQFVPIGNEDFGMDQIIYIEEELYYMKRIFHYNFENASCDKVYQVVPRSNRRRFFYLRMDNEQTVIHEERELNYNEAKEVDFNPSQPALALKFEGANYIKLNENSGLSKSVETGNEVEIKQWIYLSQNGKNQQVRVVEGDRLVKVHFGNPVASDYLKIKK